MKTKLTTADTPSSSMEERPPLNEILKMLGMKEITANVFSLPSKKKQP